MWISSVINFIVFMQILFLVFIKLENYSQHSRPVSPDSRASFCFITAEGQRSHCYLIRRYKYNNLQRKIDAFMYSCWIYGGFTNKLDKDISLKVRKQSEWKKESESFAKHISIGVNQQLLSFRVLVWSLPVILINTHLFWKALQNGHEIYVTNY